jgi:hypothetical protein
MVLLQKEKENQNKIDDLNKLIKIQQSRIDVRQTQAKKCVLNSQITTLNITRKI